MQPRLCVAGAAASAIFNRQDHLHFTPEQEPLHCSWHDTTSLSAQLCGCCRTRALTCVEGTAVPAPGTRDDDGALLFDKRGGRLHASSAANRPVSNNIAQGPPACSACCEWTTFLRLHCRRRWHGGMMNAGGTYCRDAPN